MHADEVFQDCRDRRTAARSTARHASVDTGNIGDQLHALTTAAQLFASALPSIEPYVVPCVKSVPSTAHGSVSSHGAAMAVDSPPTPDRSAQHAAHSMDEDMRDEDVATAEGTGSSVSGGGGVAGGAVAEPSSTPLVAWKVRGHHMRNHSTTRKASGAECWV